jgi:hypothetical protein
MNYIVSFLYLITSNEEETFFLFLGLYKNTDFHLLFQNDLSKLKQFFYIFDRLLIIYTPELNSYFFHNGIGSSFYCSAWFMTLFTNSYQNGDSRLSFILFHIWDDFILNGWWGILKAAIIMFVIYEKKILSLTYDEMLGFLFNDVLKFGFFNEKVYFLYEKIFNQINFPCELFNSLENEYIQGLKVSESFEVMKRSCINEE